MPAMELITGKVFDAGTLKALTPLAGNSLTVRNAPDGTAVRLLQAWMTEDAINHLGQLVIRSPLMHDNVRGISLIEGGSRCLPLLNNLVRQTLFPQDTLTLEALGVAGAAVYTFGSILLWYEDLIGVESHFIDPSELRDRSTNLMTVENTITALDTGEYATAEAINAESDLFKANTEYAIIGYVCQNIAAQAIRYRASSWGNLGIGGPANELNPHLMSQWFTNLSEQVGIPLIPVFNSAERANVLIDMCTDETATDQKVITYLAQLR
ncbi:hypothetical protein ES703_119136 [subsurface metagenome]